MRGFKENTDKANRMLDRFSEGNGTEADNATDTAVMEPPPKRGPGRPRKVPLTATAPAEKPSEKRLHITPLRLGRLNLKIVGTSAYLQARFSEKAMHMIQEKHEAGSQGKNKKVRKARDFDVDCEEAKHKFDDGTCGIPCAAFRSAMITACKLVGFHMTMAKLCIFVVADGEDVVDGTPLVRINGKVQRSILPVRNANGVADLRSRPMWRKWDVNLSVEFDRDQFSESDVYNLINRAGMQVGVGEGRNASKESNGMGWGCFRADVAKGAKLTVTEVNSEE